LWPIFNERKVTILLYQRGEKKGHGKKNGLVTRRELTCQPQLLVTKKMRAPTQTEESMRKRKGKKGEVTSSFLPTKRGREGKSNGKTGKKKY